MKFEDWFYGQQKFSLRAEWFYDDLASYHADMVGDQNIVRWLKAAYEAGREHERLSHWDDGK